MIQAKQQEVIGAINYYKADNTMVVTNSYFTNPTIELAKSKNVKLIDQDKLITMIIEMNPHENKVSSSERNRCAHHVMFIWFLEHPEMEMNFMVVLTFHLVTKLGMYNKYISTILGKRRQGYSLILTVVELIKYIIPIFNITILYEARFSCKKKLRIISTTIKIAKMKNGFLHNSHIYPDS